MPSIADSNRTIARNEDYILFRGDSHTFVFELVDPCGEGPFDLTGYTAALYAKGNPKNTALVWNKVGTINTPSKGVVEVEVDATDTATPGHLVVELELTETATSKKVTVGQFTVAIVEDLA